MQNVGNFQFNVLNALRGISACMIVLFHMSTFSDTIILNNNFIYHSSLFVDFFFVLSGFVISFKYQEIATSKRFNLFFKQRFKRIYPLHLFMLLVFLIVEGVKVLAKNQIHINNAVDNSVTTFFTSLFLLNSIKLPNVNDVSWNIQSWSISAEMISYITFAILCRIFYKFKIAKYFIYLGVAIGALITMRLITGNYFINYSYDYGFLRGLGGFFSGAFCYLIFSKIHPYLKDANSWFFTALEVIILTVIAVSVYLGQETIFYGYLYEVIFVLAICIFAFEKGHISAAIKTSILLNNLGKYSYSIYMVHTLFLSFLNVLFIRVLNLPPSSYSYLFIVNLGLVYYASKLSYLYIEMHFYHKKPIPVKQALKIDFQFI